MRAQRSEMNFDENDDCGNADAGDDCQVLMLIAKNSNADDCQGEYYCRQCQRQPFCQRRQSTLHHWRVLTVEWSQSKSSG